MNVALFLKSALSLTVYAGIVAGLLMILDKKRQKPPAAAEAADADQVAVLAAEVEDSTRALISVVRCKGSLAEAPALYENLGTKDCRQQYILFGGNKACESGCLAGLHCVGVCPNHAISKGSNGLPEIDTSRCVGCGKCVKECPRRVLELIARSPLIYLACNSRTGPGIKDLCSVGCTACNVCVEECPHAGAIRVAENHAHINYEKCTSCGICYQKCPANSFLDRARTRPYALISLQCDGCGDCKRLCQFEAIQGKMGKRHQVMKEKCIGCGRCFEVCPIRVITMVGALGYTQSA
jgi:electron transport complex protein RnfB